MADEINALKKGDVLSITVISKSGKKIKYTPKNNQYCSFSIGYDNKSKGSLATSDGVRLSPTNKSLICDKRNHSIKGNISGGRKIIIKFGNKAKYKKICNMIESHFIANKPKKKTTKRKAPAKKKTTKRKTTKRKR